MGDIKRLMREEKDRFLRSRGAAGATYDQWLAHVFALAETDSRFFDAVQKQMTQTASAMRAAGTRPRLIDEPE